MARAARALSTDRERAGPAGLRDGADGPADTCDLWVPMESAGWLLHIWLMGLGGQGTNYHDAGGRGG